MRNRFRRLRRLAFALAPEIHPERFAAAGLPKSLPASLAKSPRAAAALSLDLSWTGMDVPPVGALWDDAGAKELDCFLSGGGPLLWRAGLRLGAGHMRGILARFVLRADVTLLKTAIGDDAYIFALRQAPLFWRRRELPDDGAANKDQVDGTRVGATRVGDTRVGNARVDDAPGNGVLARGGASATGDAKEAAARTVAAAGWGLGCFLANLPAAAAARVRLTLPPEADPAMDAAAAWPETRRKPWQTLFLEIAGSIPPAT